MENADDPRADGSNDLKPISVIVPAHDEARVIGRLLERLLSSARTGEFEVIVVANGCTDDTAAVASAFGPAIRVLTVPVASKREALVIGDRAARGFPRLYVDADVELGATDVRALGAALTRRGVLAAAPERVLVTTGRPWPVRWYYDVWARLPEVQRGLFGRGVVGVSEAGHDRITGLPPVMADDLAASMAFTPAERVIVPAARVLVHTPRTLRDLLRRRVRATVGAAQMERMMTRAPSQAHQSGEGEGLDAGTRTKPSDLVTIARHDLRAVPRISLFLAVAVAARLAARRTVRRGDYSTWLRDESSRS